MKKIKIYLIILAVALLSSCTDKFLDIQNPNNQTTDNFWKTEADLQAGVIACYHPMNDQWSGYYGAVFSFLIDARSVDIWNGPTTLSNYMLYTNNASYTGSGAQGGGYWQNCYTGINYCNQVIEYGSAAPLDASVKDKYIAEAYFLRGLYYFFLVNDFGSVPIHTSVAKTLTELQIDRSPIEDVWQLVISDFTKAAEGLPAVRAEADGWKATKGTALAFLGRSYLYRGDWANAEATLKSIVDNASTYQYKLQENYAELFDGQHENMVAKGGGEDIFAIQYSDNGTDEYHGGWADKFSTWEAILFAPLSVNGWDAGIWIDPWMFGDFTKELTVDGKYDPRAEATIAWDHYPLDPNYTYYQRNFHDTWGNEGWTKDGVFYPKMFIKKYQNWWNSGENIASFLDEYGMRYADVLLMLAEAYTMNNGNVAAAAPLVKQIRDRAQLPVKDFTASPDVMMTEIRHQRHLEFGYEQRYFYDLRRWGLMEQTVNEAKRDGYQNYTSKCDYLPIPQAELDSNPNIRQEDAWKTGN